MARRDDQQTGISQAPARHKAGVETISTSLEPPMGCNAASLFSFSPRELMSASPCESMRRLTEDIDVSLRPEVLDRWVLRYDDVVSSDRGFQTGWTTVGIG